MVLDGPNKKSGMKCGVVDSRAKAETSRKTSVIRACAHKSSPSGQRGQSNVPQSKTAVKDALTHTQTRDSLMNAPRMTTGIDATCPCYELGGRGAALLMLVFSHQGLLLTTRSP